MDQPFAPILGKEGINLEAQGTEYWLTALNLRGQLQQQNIMAGLWGALEDMGGLRTRLLFEWDENESAMAALQRKLVEEEKSMGEWEAMMG